MQTGLYEQVINLFLSRKIATSDQKHIDQKLDVADSHTYLAQYLHEILLKGLSQIQPESGIKGEKERSKSRLKRQIETCNQIIDILNNPETNNFTDEKISDEAKQLLAVLDKTSSTIPQRADTPLSLGALLTGTNQDPSFISQLKKEIESADKIDILCSFIKWSGIRILSQSLESFLKKENAQLRIITTSYIGATDCKAIDYLSKLPNTEVKISYDTHRTRLHAKAYLIYRKTGFSSAYIGSSNVSHAALTDGLEWNVKISQYEQPFQWNRISATFNSYWNDSEFESYNSETDCFRLKKALLEAHNPNGKNNFQILNFDIKPYAFQQEILDKIDYERQIEQRSKHLIVAATGTGKTMIAAFDFKNWLRQMRKIGKSPRFLFIAHREEILKQAQYTFRAVLRDQNFGDLMVSGLKPTQNDNLFVSIQTYNSQEMAGILPQGHYDYVIIDEFHHAAARSYKKLLSYIKPKSLLGLTATPERGDGQNIKEYFDNHLTAEIRLADAVNRKLLSPFQYFGVSDSVDYSTLRWERGGYNTTDLDRILSANDVRAKLVIEKVIEYLLDVHQARGLGFCVSKKHAEYMSTMFNNAAIPSDFLTADSSPEHRKNVQARLIDRKINFIFVVDLYNEGIDIPEIDTVLFLRPTESLTVFLQQLGRGLRSHDDKDYLTVLDFVGQAHKKFQFAARLSHLLSKGNHRIKNELENGFPNLPAGCSIQFERIAYQHVLENIQQSIKNQKSQIIQNIATFEADTGLKLTLANFLDYYELSIEHIYKRACWFRLCAEAKNINIETNPNEEILTKGLLKLAHINDSKWITFLLTFISSPTFNLANITKIDCKMLEMLFITLFGTANVSADLKTNIDILFKNPNIVKDLIELLKIRREQIVSVAPKKRFSFDCPLEIHSEYSSQEILIGLGHWNLKSQPAMREGVLHLKHIKADAFFITLNKTEKHYSPTTMYEDYAISETLFHWQSQSQTSEISPTGQRYINHKQNNHSILLFVREEKKDKNGNTSPYSFLGTAQYVEHSGSKPISIVWKLDYPMPAHLLRKTARLIAK